MKIRNGFVSNSSSSSFIIAMGEPETEEDFSTWVCTSLKKEVEEFKETKEELSVLLDVINKSNFNNNEKAKKLLDRLLSTSTIDINGFIDYNEKTSKFEFDGYDVLPEGHSTVDSVIKEMYDGYLIGKTFLLNKDEFDHSEIDRNVFIKITDKGKILPKYKRFLKEMVEDFVKNFLMTDCEEKLGRKLSLGAYYTNYRLTAGIESALEKSSVKKMALQLENNILKYIKREDLDLYCVRYASDEGDGALGSFGTSGIQFKGLDLVIRVHNG